MQKAWDMVVEEERSDLIKDFFSLAENQRKLMIHIANYGGLNLHSSESAKKMDIPVSSISRALSSLIEKDYIERTDEEYRLIAPVYRKLLNFEDV